MRFFTDCMPFRAVLNFSLPELRAKLTVKAPANEEKLLLVMFPRRANEWEAKQMFYFLASNQETNSGETFFASRTQILRPQQMLRERANRETFTSATRFPRLRGPLGLGY